MIQVRMQYSLNRDHQHHKWRQQKSWISYPDCQGAQDNQLMQQPLLPRSKEMMHRRCWKFQSQKVQTFGFVYHDTNGQNHGPVWETQSFRLNGICTVILWQDYHGNGSMRKFYWNTVGKIPNWKCLFVNREKDYFFCVSERYQTGWEKQNISPTWTFLIKDGDLGEPTSSIDHVYLVFSTARILWIITEVCSNQGFLPGLQKNCQKQKTRWNLKHKEMCGKILRICE